MKFSCKLTSEWRLLYNRLFPNSELLALAENFPIYKFMIQTIQNSHE